MSLRRIAATAVAVLVPAVGLADGWKLSHYGIDAFELLKDAAGWKITQLSDTRRRESCRDVLK